MAWEAIETAPKDGSKFFAAQDGEVYVAQYNIYLVPAELVFRYHRIHFVQKRAYFLTEFEGVMVRASTPLEAGHEESEHIWRLETSSFQFRPTHWMPYEEPPR